MHDYTLFISGTGLLSLVNTLFILFFLNYHDDIISSLNTVKNRECIKKLLSP